MDITLFKNKAQRGFTLLEILIFVAILGVLASIAVPQYQDYLARQQISAAFSDIEKLKKLLLQTHQHDKLTCHTVSAQITGIFPLPSSDTTGSYMDELQFTGLNDSAPESACMMTVIFKKETAASPLAGKKLQFALHVDPHDVAFTCLKNGATTIAERLLPSGCIVSDLLS